MTQAAAWQVPVHRVSQGSGIMLLADSEIARMAELGERWGIEVNLFVGPRAIFDIGAQAYSPAGKSLGLSVRGSEQLAYAIEDVRHAVSLGIQSVLVADIGLLAILGKMRRSGDMPEDLVLKTSVMMAPANAASARVLEDLGASTINVPSDLSIPQLASIRSAIDAPIDLYVEAPDNIGGFVRHYEVPEFIRVGRSAIRQTRAAQRSGHLSERHAHRGHGTGSVQGTGSTSPSDTGQGGALRSGSQDLADRLRAVADQRVLTLGGMEAHG